MVRKQRKRISYVLPLANSVGGHRLGINGLAVDTDRSILYSGGRDGVICAWDLNLDLNSRVSPPPSQAQASDPFSSPTSPSPSHFPASAATSAALSGATAVPPLDSYSFPRNTNSSTPRQSYPPTTASPPAASPPCATTLRHQVQAHTHWVNDIVLAAGNEALVSASSDITVRLWRPSAHASLPPQTIGKHSDYVKCLASPAPGAPWVASGGLDRRICLWDLRGGGEVLRVGVGDEVEDGEKNKGSVYALGATENLIAGGGPESVVRVWDARSGKRATKFVGHTDNIRAVLIADDGETVMSASSDQTVKLWSMSAGRCMYTLTMHSDSVWSLYSEHPKLSVFWSADRSGLVAKTDTRGKADVDEGLCVAVCQEGSGVNRVVGSGRYIWTATSSSSLHRWADAKTEDAEILLSETFSVLPQRASVSTISTRPRLHSPSMTMTTSPISSISPGFGSASNIRQNSSGSVVTQIPFRSLLRLSNTAPFHILRNRDADTLTMYSAASLRKPSEVFSEPDELPVVPLRSHPDYTIEGQHGLIKHVTLNDRRKVLTLDTAGEVVMWDLIKCEAVRCFGKRHLDDVLSQVNTMETVAHWCAVDTRTGSLTCVLDENTCFDAEMYADEVDIAEKIDFKEDQRINLGKWVLRYLFSNLIDEEIRRDDTFRRDLFEKKHPELATERLRPPPGTLHIPPPGLTSWLDTSSAPNSASTLKPPSNGFNLSVQTPGLAIGIATPHPQPSQTPGPLSSGLSPTAEEGSQTDLTQIPSDQSTQDYFNSRPAPNPPIASSNPGTLASPGVPPTPASPDNGRPHSSDPAALPDQSLLTPLSPDPEGHGASPEKSGRFGKKFRMNFSMKSLKKSTTQAEPKTPAPEEHPSDSDSRSSRTEERNQEDNFLSVVTKLRSNYEVLAKQQEQSISSKASRLLGKEPASTELPTIVACAITPSMPSDTPVLKPPGQTVLLIQEDSMDSGGVADVWIGTVGSVGQEADVVEKVAPAWLAEVLLRNTMPAKELVKVSFTLEPIENLLPPVASDGRLNANRMLRARKILAYIAERIEPQPDKPDPNAMRPEEYLEIYCHGQRIPPTMTLATIRAHIWRGGGDVLLHYKTNGKKTIAPFPPVGGQTGLRKRSGSSTKTASG